MRHSLPPAAAVALAGALAAWSCGGGSSSPTAPTPAAVAPAAPTAATPAPSPPTTTPSTVTVSIVTSAGNQAFSPNPAPARAGDTVMFRNSDAFTHHLVFDDGSGDFGEVAPGATSRGIVLRSANPATFHCTLHATMVGSINGSSAPPTPPCEPDIYGYGC